MSLDNFFNGIWATDRKLQKGANNLAHKVNEWVGIGNYQLSSAFFGAAAAWQTYQVGSNIYTAVTTPNHVVNPFPFLYGALSIYHFVKNRSLERREKEQVTGADAVAVDFNFLREKKNLYGGGAAYLSAKPIYAWFLSIDLPAVFRDLSAVYDISMLLGQYFREVDHLKPTKKNKVFDFFRNIIPKGVIAPQPMPGNASASALLAADT